MRNLLKCRPRRETKPTLRERATILKAAAAKVIRRERPEATTGTLAIGAALPNGVAFAVNRDVPVILSGLKLSHLACLFDRFEDAAAMWNAELHLAYCDSSDNEFRFTTAAGEFVERAQKRAAEIRDLIAAGIGRREPASQWDADVQLEALVRRELMCSGDLRAPAIRARIEATWGDRSSGS